MRPEPAARTRGAVTEIGALPALASRLRPHMARRARPAHCPVPPVPRQPMPARRERRTPALMAALAGTALGAAPEGTGTGARRRPACCDRPLPAALPQPRCPCSVQALEARFVFCRVMAAALATALGAATACGAAGAAPHPSLILIGTRTGQPGQGCSWSLQWWH